MSGEEVFCDLPKWYDRSAGEEEFDEFADLTEAGQIVVQYRPVPRGEWIILVSGSDES